MYCPFDAKRFGRSQQICTSSVRFSSRRAGKVRIRPRPTVSVGPAASCSSSAYAERLADDAVRVHIVSTAAAVVVVIYVCNPHVPRREAFPGGRTYRRPTG